MGGFPVIVVLDLALDHHWSVAGAGGGYWFAFIEHLTFLFF